MARIETIYRRSPLSGSSPIDISASTTYPSVEGDADCAIVDDPSGSDEAPRYLAITMALTGTAADAATVAWRLCLWDPIQDAWIHSEEMTAGGRDTIYGQGFRVEVPEGVTRAKVHIPSLPTDVVAHAVIRAGM